MQKIVKTVNGAEYSFYNNSYGNRSGFVHTCELIRNGFFVLGKTNASTIIAHGNATPISRS